MKANMGSSRRLLVKTAMLAAVYAASTILMAPISYGAVQVRLSEALTLLPFFWGPWAAIGVWLGCLVANIFGGFGILDIIGGSTITLVAAYFTARSPNKWIAAVPPIILNAFGVAGILHITIDLPYWGTVLYVGVGEAIAVLVVGVPAMTWLTSHLSRFLDM